MMQPEQVKPFFLHPRQTVREMAARYFRERHSRDPELVSLVAQAVQRFGVRECGCALWCLNL